MSWFTDLAGKAEQLLNKVDQTAATAFSKDEIANNSSLKSFVPYYQHSTELKQHTPVSMSYQTPIVSSSVVDPGKSPVKTASVTKPKTKQEIEDEKLFNFLNREDKPVTSKQEKAKNFPQGSNSLVAQDTKLSMKKESAESVTDSPATTTTNEKNLTIATSKLESQQDEPAAASCDTEAAQQVDEPIIYNNAVPQSQSRLSSLEFENQMLKNEISSQKEEAGKLLQRITGLEDELQDNKKTSEKCSAEILSEEKIIGELKEREADLKQALNAKDSQLAVLRVRLQEADQELASKRELVEKLQVENRRILEDHTSSSGLHSQAIVTIQERLQQTEGLLERERINFKTTQNESLQRISNLEEELQLMAANYNDSQSKFLEEKSQVNELTSQLKTWKNTLEVTQQELMDYKAKAQRILQSKEKLIATLKESGCGRMEMAQDGSDISINVVELEELRQERDMLRDEVMQANIKVKRLLSELHDLEVQMQQEIDTVREHYRDIEESYKEEQSRKKDLEQELQSVKEELKYLNEDYSRQKTTLQSRIHDRDMEIEKLRKQLVAKQVNTTSQTELESRLNALTENLIQKQTMVEALSTEKNSLVFQLERLEKQLKEHSAYSRRTTSTAVNVAEDHDAKLRVPSFMTENPFDGQVTRKVKHVYNSIDTLSIRLGVFLRRYPVARILIIIYMVMLHFWVFIVLLTYTPEMHSKDYPHDNSS